MSLLRVVQAAVFAGLVALLLLFYWHVELAKMLPATAPDGVFGLPTGDFPNLWSAGRLARSESFPVLYSVDGFTAWKQAAFGHGVTQNDWIYPPMVLPLGAVFSFLPVWAGFLLWSFGTLAAMLWLLRLAGLGWGAVALGVACPAEGLSLIYGQYGGIIGCLGFAGLVLAARRPVAAGVMLGLVTLKPQTGFLVPLAWLAARRWRAIAVAGAVFGVVALLPVIWFGLPSWAWFLRRSGGMAAALVQAKFGQGYQLTGTSVFWMLRSFGLGLRAAYAGQLAAALGAAALVVRLWRGEGDAQLRASVTMFLALFVAPYGFSADMAGYSVGLAVLAARRGWRVTLLDGLLWLWPGYAAVVTDWTGVLLTPVAVALAAVMGWRQARRPA
jgi:alpha-1,2-mannosyltransferase